MTFGNIQSAPADTASFSPLDLHFGRLIEKTSQAKDPLIALSAALASNAVQEGNVCVDLAAHAGKPCAFDNAPAAIGRWPGIEQWTAALSSNAAVGSPGENKPLILSSNRLYLFRYWDYERRLVAAIRNRLTGPFEAVDYAALSAALDLLFPQPCDGIDWQKAAAAAAALETFCVISGGPGTGKTTTVIRIMALLLMLKPGRRMRIALAAPTGKAAARLEETINANMSSIPCPAEIKESIPRSASTIHSLLGTIPGSPYFRHTRDNPLPCDAVVVDEASMVDLALMTKLFEAIPETSRIILLGDRDQLASVEAGAVLGDICDTGTPHGYTPGFCETLRRVLPSFSMSGSAEPALADHIVTLRKSHRFNDTSGIGAVSRAINNGSAAEAIALLHEGTDGACVWWAPSSYEDLLGRLNGLVAPQLRGYLAAADPAEAIRRFNAFRILCAVRRGPLGVGAVNGYVESGLSRAGLIPPAGPWYCGRPVLITRNDYDLGLYNGDTGIIAPDPNGHGAPTVFFPGTSGRTRHFSPHRLPEHETAYALTVHKAQGSEFDHVVIILPQQVSPVLTRELLYTGITRARNRCELWCTEEVLHAAIETRTARVSGLREELWQ